MKGEQKEWSGDFKNQILSALRQRNRRERDGFTELFQDHQRLFDNWAAVRAENLRLQLERGSDSRRMSGASVGGGASEEREKALEQKVLKLQEELTELHRKRGENASQVLSLSAKLTDRETELSQTQTQLAQSVARVAELEEELKFLITQNQSLEATNELLRDEHQALHMAYSSMEEKYLANVKENAELVQRYIELKAQHADLMNQENENFVKKRQAKVQKELEDAAKETRAVIETEEGIDACPPSGIDAMTSIISDYCLVPSKPTYTVESPEGEVHTVRWSPNGRYFATGGMDRKVKLWENTNQGPVLRGTLTGANASILSIDYDSSTTLVVAASSTDNSVRLWTIDDHRLRHTLTGHSGKVLGARFLGDPSKVASGSHDRTLKIWDLRSRACVSTKFAGSSCNDLVCVDGSSIISGHFDKRIRFWDARTESPTQEVDLPGKITSLDISMDKNFLLASVRDDSLEVVDLRMNSIIAQYTADGFKVSTDSDRACFSPNGQYIACGSADGSIFVWSVMESKLDTVLKEHSAPVVAVHWHPQGICLVSADKAKKTVVWTP